MAASPFPDETERQAIAARLRGAAKASRIVPQAAAQRIVATRFTSAAGRTLHFWQGEFHQWNGVHYAPMPAADMRALVYDALGRSARKRDVDETLDALRAVANLSDRLPSPTWIGPRDEALDPAALIPMRNGLLRIDDRALLPATARLFVPWGLEFDYADDAPQPLRWLQFLNELWGDDAEALGLLQEWFGYSLTADTSQQKALMLVGPKRGGKGTIARVLGRLVGTSNVVSPTLASLGTQFGLAPLIGKPLAIISDARLGGRADVHAVAENILRITGEDAISVPRKYLPDFTATLPTRVMVLTNEAPRFTDASGALPSRFMILRSSVSFYGREDPHLTARLLPELPGILRWALDGLDRLQDRGHFVQPAGAVEVVEEMERLASPVKAFIDERCVIDPGAETPCQTLYGAWKDWCEDNGRQQPGTLQTFGRDLHAACSAVRTARPRDMAGSRQRVYANIRPRVANDPD
jgi:putative DNA primase/helicase